jgi:cephalosporin-C deacetylase-like acetyl esterase
MPYERWVMYRAFRRILYALTAAACLGTVVAPFLCAAASAQGPATAQTSPAPHPDNSGRKRLDDYLDGMAAQYTAQRVAAVAAISTRAAVEARQAAVRQKITALVGGLPQRTPLNARITGETQAEGFAIRRVIFESQPGLRVTGLLYLPTGQTAKSKRPAILMTPGHYPTSKRNDAGVAALFAMHGFVVLSYDPVGMGERLEYPDPAQPGKSLAGQPTAEHGEASLQPMLIGDTLARYMVWDAMRGVDYLSQLPQVDPHRIGAFGCSGGGTVTALLGALDTRVAAVGVACYITSFDALLPALGPQDAEQSDPRFISSGFDFPDWIELAAPRPYAVVSTYSDMFPFAGARASVIEARRFYALFDPQAAGTAAGDSNPIPSIPPIPSGPAWNADTSNQIPPQAPLQFITGPGRHGALAPIMGEILSFFMHNLQPGCDAEHPKLPPEYLQLSPANPMNNLPASTWQVTPTGQVSSSYKDEQTVFSLNKERAEKLMARRKPLIGAELVSAIQKVAGPDARPGAVRYDANLLEQKSGPIVLAANGYEVEGEIGAPEGVGRHPAVLFLVPDSIRGAGQIASANKAKFDALVARGNVVLALTPRPSPPGTDDMKSPLLGPFYLLSLRADLVGKTLLGLRVDDVIRATDYLAGRADVDPERITVFGSGHMGLVLLHAAVLDHRLRHVTVDHVLTSYRSLAEAPLPVGAAEDVLPRVLLEYDLPDLKRALGSRLTATDWLDGSRDLSQTSTPIDTLRKPQK